MQVGALPGEGGRVRAPQALGVVVGVALLPQVVVAGGEGMPLDEEQLVLPGELVGDALVQRRAGFAGVGVVGEVEVFAVGAGVGEGEALPPEPRAVGVAQLGAGQELALVAGEVGIVAVGTAEIVQAAPAVEEPEVGRSRQGGRERVLQPAGGGGVAPGA